MFPHHFWLPVQNWMLIQCVAGKLEKIVCPYPQDMEHVKRNTTLAVNLVFIINSCEVFYGCQ